MTGKLLSTGTAARLVGDVKARTVRDWIKAGVVDGQVILGRYYVYSEALAELIKRRQYKGTE